MNLACHKQVYDTHVKKINKKKNNLPLKIAKSLWVRVRKKTTSTTNLSFCVFKNTRKDMTIIETGENGEWGTHKRIENPLWGFCV